MCLCVGVCVYTVCACFTFILKININFSKPKQKRQCEKILHLNVKQNSWLSHHVHAHCRLKYLKSVLTWWRQRIRSLYSVSLSSNWKTSNCILLWSQLIGAREYWLPLLSWVQVVKSNFATAMEHVTKCLMEWNGGFILSSTPSLFCCSHTSGYNLKGLKNWIVLHYFQSL